MNTKSKPLPENLIRESLIYDETSPTGLRWKTRPRSHFKTEIGWKIFNAMYAGKEAGSEITGTHEKKYWQVRINNQSCKAHRLVYFIIHGIDPSEMEVDHRDGNGQNNNHANLRLATRSENMRNQKPRADSTSGIKGVHYDKKGQRYRAYITLNGRLSNLGSFRTREDAISARVAATHQFHGEFARLL